MVCLGECWMLVFKNMRHRVEFAYDKMNVDIYYDGEYKYTIEDHQAQEMFEQVEVEQMDEILSKIWNDTCLSKS